MNFYAKELAKLERKRVGRAEEQRNFIIAVPEIIHRKVALCVFMKAITPTKLSVSSTPRPNSTSAGGITFIGSGPPSSFFAPEKLRRKKTRNWPDAKLSPKLLTQRARTLKIGLPLEFWLNSSAPGLDVCLGALPGIGVQQVCSRLGSLPGCFAESR